MSVPSYAEIRAKQIAYWQSVLRYRTWLIEPHFDPTNDPTANDDFSSGFRKGQFWLNQSTDSLFICEDASDGAAVWVPAGTGSGSGFISGAVNTYTDLPDPVLNAGSFYLVKNPSGVYLVNRKPRGLYYSDGVKWASAPDIIPFFDSANFGVYDVVDNTKQIGFDLSTITTGNKRNLIMADQDVDLSLVLSHIADPTKHTFGSERFYLEDLTTSSTTGTTFQPKLNLNFSVLGGTYAILLNYGWNHNRTTSDFEGRLTLDGNIIMFHKQEAKDAAGTDPTGTTQRYFNTFTKEILLPVGAHNLLFDYRTDTAGQASSVMNTSISVWRVI